MPIREDQRTLRSPICIPVWLWITYIVASVIAILFYIRFWPEAPVTCPDSPGYMEVAQDLLDLRLDRAHLRPIGYPLLLALTHSAYKPTRMLFIVQLTLYILSVGLLLTVVGKLKGMSKVAILIFITLLFLPPFADPAAYVLTEHLSRFTLVVGVVGLLQWFNSRRWIWLILSLIGFIYAVVTHPIYTFLPPIVAVALLVIRCLFPWVHLQKKETFLYSVGLIGV